ncbi:hypothetical protein KAU45_05435 [bacterium]|nr:hypothetical protein [bacterium]
MRFRGPGEPAKTLPGLISILSLAGCLFIQSAPAPRIDRLLVVDLRPGYGVSEEQASGVENMLAERISLLPGIVPLTRRDLTKQLGGTVALGEEYREPGSLARPVLTLPPDLQRMCPQLYLIGELRAFGRTEGVGEIGFQRDEAVVKLNARLYLAITGEFITEMETEHAYTQSNSNPWRPGIVIGPNEEFLNTLEGRASQGAVERMMEGLESSVVNTPWSGRIDDADGEMVILPIGFEQNVVPGDVFIIYGPSDIRGERGNRIGSVRIESTGPHESLASPISGGGFQPGQLVVQEL